MPSVVEDVMEVDLAMEPTTISSSMNGAAGPQQLDPSSCKFVVKSTNGNCIQINQLLTSFKQDVKKALSPVLSGDKGETKAAFENASSLINQASETSEKLTRFISSNNFLFKTTINNLRFHPFSKPDGSRNGHVNSASNLLWKKDPAHPEGLEILSTVPVKKVSNLPPVGDLKREPIEVGAKVFAMKSNFLGVWVRGTVQYVRNSNLEQLYKVRCDTMKGHAVRYYTAKQIAYESNASVIVPVGTRIIARYTDNGGRWAHYAGIVAEPPKTTNEKRYLIFFDDGCAQYVMHEDIHVVCAQSNDVADDVHENICDFVRSYLQQYPERPMVKLQTNQYVKTEYNCEWSDAKVLEVDCSMVKMLFLTSQREEWIYRGSTRLKPLSNELANAEAHRLEGKHRRRHTTAPRRPHQPYVEYTREDVVTLDSDSDSENKSTFCVQKPRNTARKSLGTRPLTSLNVRANPIFHLPDKKSHLGYKELSRLKTFTRLPYRQHLCSFQCREKDDPSRHKGKNPLLIPVFLGWERQIRKLRFSGPGPRNKIVYRAPCGRHLRSLADIQRYLTIVESRLTIDLFSFSIDLVLFRTFRPKDVLFENTDITDGKENVPVSCVNSLTDEAPPFVEYSAERFPGKGVFLNLDEEFLCGCSCTDNCQNPNICECQRITNDGKFSSGKLGYKFRRLTEPVITGIYECNSKCHCNAQCGNRVVQHGLTVRLQMFKTMFKGWGIRCLDDIEAGQFICVYAGQLLTEQGADADGKECGDEYLAELDYIEIVEKTKEGYESDVPEFANEREDPTYSVSKEETILSSDENYNSDDSDVMSADSGSDFEFLQSTATSTIATRTRRKGGPKNGNPSGSRSSLFTSEDSASSQESDKKDKNLPDISSKIELFNISPRELSPESVEALEKVELKRKPEILTKESSGKAVAKKSGSMKNPMNCPSESKDAKFKSVRSYYGEDSLYIMDAKTKGNIGRYLNHSCEPNVFVQNVFVDTHDLRFPAVAFFAQHTIDAGTELTWDYNYEVGSVADKVMYCYCEAPSCRGRLL